MMNDYKDRDEVPLPNSYPWLGIFGEQIYPLNSKEENKLLSLEVNLAYHPDITKDNSSNKLFIGCQIKSKYDGIGNRNQPIDVVIILDVSGSMETGLKNSENGNKLNLSINAIRKLVEKLDSEDRIGLCTFNNISEEIFPLTERKCLNLDSHINDLVADGSTNISVGMKCGIEIMQKGVNSNRSCIKRIILITDMGNDVEENENLINYINQASDYGIFISIIGVGYDLDVNLIERVSKTKGFNYFSVVEDAQLQEIFENFNLNFFPIASDITLSIESNDIVVEKVYGTNFDNKILQLSNQWNTHNHLISNSKVRNYVKFLHLYFNRIGKRLPKPVLSNIIRCWSEKKVLNNLCDMGTLSATKLICENGKDYMQGKFFIIKCSPINQLPANIDVAARLKLLYKDLEGNSHEDKYYIRRRFIGSSSLDINISIGLCAFFHGKFMRQIMRQFHRRNGNKHLRESAEKFLEIENLTNRNQNIQEFINSFWTGRESEKDRLFSKYSDLIAKVLNNINERSDKFSDYEDIGFEQIL
jgi:uncharacterized protein YegL